MVVVVVEVLINAELIVSEEIVAGTEIPGGGGERETVMYLTLPGCLFAVAVINI